MADHYGKQELMEEIQVGWSRLNSALDALTFEQVNELRDPVGWNVKDHVTHMTAWERSVLLFLQGQPRHVGLGVSQSLYAAHDLDGMNSSIRQNGVTLSMGEARAAAADVHYQLVQQIEPLSDEDLLRANSEYAPSSSGEYDDRAIITTIYMNTVEHYAEHLEWIETIVSKA